MMRPRLRARRSRDIDKIMNIPAYNRYAGKRRYLAWLRTTTSAAAGCVQLVGRIARNIGRLLGLNCQLIEAIALGHDLGHTPFGHAGEVPSRSACKPHGPLLSTTTSIPCG